MLDPGSWVGIRSDAPWWAILLAILLTALIINVVWRLVSSLIRVARATSLRRARHRLAVDLLDEVEAHPTNATLRVLAERLPVAYCLPGLRRSRVVLSAGTLSLLARDEVAAVIAHENAHVRARHDLVLDTFSALHRAFPVAVRSELPERECRLLVEMLADDAARHRVGDRPLARALVALADTPVPTEALGAGQTGVLLRVRAADSSGCRLLPAAGRRRVPARRRPGRHAAPTARALRVSLSDPTHTRNRFPRPFQGARGRWTTRRSPRLRSTVR